MQLTMRRCMSCGRFGLSCVALSLPLTLARLVHEARADLVIDTNTTQSGGTLDVDPAGALIVTHDTNDPLLTLTAGATANNASGVEAVIVGSLADESGALLINGASTLSSVGVGAGGLGTYGAVSVDRGAGYIGLNAGSQGTATVTGAGSTWANERALSIGYFGIGELNIQNGGAVSNTFGFIAYDSFSQGTVTVTGTGSTWQNSSELSVGLAGEAELNITNGAQVSNTHGYLSYHFTAQSTATVTGAGSAWINSGELAIGYGGTSELHILDGGSVTNTIGVIGHGISSQGSVTVSGSGSHWSIADNLHVGVDGQATLNINSNGLVSVDGTTSIGTFGMISLNGGRLEFGTMSISNFSAINGISGSLAGTVNHTGFSDASYMTPFLAGGSVDITDVHLINTGVIYGNALLGSSIVNTASGQLEAIAGERLRFLGSGTNDGEIYNFDGQVRFQQTLTNNATGFIAGRGQFIAMGGWTNEGVMAFSGGFTDVVGDVNNITGGTIVTTGNALTTFYDDVINNGTEIRTSADSMTVFLGEYSGSGALTGTGTVRFEGDLRPGNSPGVITAEGDIEFASSNTTYIEIAGLLLGEFDRMEIDGNFDVNGNLVVSLIDGFVMGANQQFEIMTVGGDLNGTFTDLPEGSSLGFYDGYELFISYQWGDSNNIVLMTIPEPASLVLLVFAGLCTLRRANTGSLRRG